MKFSIEFDGTKEELPILGDVFRKLSDQLSQEPKIKLSPEVKERIGNVILNAIRTEEPALAATASTDKKPMEGPKTAPSNHSYTAVGWEPRIEMALKSLGRPATYREIVKETLGDGAHQKDFNAAISYLKNMEINKKVRRAGHANGGTILWVLA